MLVCGWGSLLVLTTAAALVWVPTIVGTAVIVTVMWAPERSVPSVHVNGGPTWQRPWLGWTETSLTGSLGVSFSVTIVAASGPRLVTVSV